MKRPVLACAHRGLSAEQPENTLASFRAAAKAGAHAIELDVHLSHDGHVVVMHDANIARTTDGVGRINDLDIAELRTYRTADGPIPTLHEVFEALAFWDGVWNIEVKASLAATKVLELMDRHGLEDRLMITSMDPDALAAVHDSSPATVRGLIVMGPPDADDFDAADTTGCTWLMVHHDYITTRLVQSCLEAGLHVGAWTVNDLDFAKALVGQGVHMVITDQRDVLDELL